MEMCSDLNPNSYSKEIEINSKTDQGQTPVLIELTRGRMQVRGFR